MRFGVLGLMAMAILFTTAPVAQALSFASEADYLEYLKNNPNDPQLTPAERAKAQELRRGNVVKDVDNVVKNNEINADTKAKIEAELKAEKARCAGLREDKKKVCLSAVDAKIKAKYLVSTDVKPFPGNIFRKDTPATGGGLTEGIKFDQDNITNFKARFEAAIKNFEATYARLIQLADRIEARLKKISSTDGKDKIDVAAKMKFVIAARADLKSAKASIESAKAVFRTESIVVSKDETTNSREIWGTDIYAKCKANSGVIKVTTPARCTLDGTTYVNADKKVDDYSNGLRAKLTKTFAHIQAAKTSLARAHKNLVQAITGVGVGTRIELNKANIKAVPATSVTAEVNANN